MKRRILILAIIIGLMGGYAALPAGAGHNPNHKPKPTTTTTSTTTTTTVPPTTTTTVPPTTTTTTPPTCGGPITITTGGTYSGCYRSTDPAVPAVRIATTAPVTLSRARIEHTGQGIRTNFDFPADLNVQDSVFQQLVPPSGGSGRAIYAYKAMELQVEHSEFIDGAGIYWQNDGTVPRLGLIRYNKVTNIGRYPTACCIQFFQTNAVNLGGLEVAWNEIRNTPLQSDIEDFVNFYQSNGTAAAPFDVHHNLFSGGHPTTLGNIQYTGVAVVLGDNGGSYQRSHDNWSVDVSNGGPAIPAGNNLEIDHEVVVSDGLANGVPTGPDWGNGMNVWDNVNYAGMPFAVSAHDNSVGFMRVNADDTLVRSDYYLPACDTVCTNNVSRPDPIDAVAEQGARNEWEAARTAAGVTTGPRPLP